MYIPALGNIHCISMLYTMDIPCLIFIGVPDVTLYRVSRHRVIHNGTKNDIVIHDMIVHYTISCNT